MILEMRIPNTGAAKKDILLTSWDVEDKDEVEQGDVIGEIETAKSSIEVEAERDGYILLIAEEDEYYDVGDIICVIADTEEELDDYQASGGSSDVEVKSEEASASDENPSMEILKTVSYKGITKTIGDFLLDASQQTAGVTVVAEADITELLEYVKELKGSLGIEKVKVNTYLMMLTAKALEEFPQFNSHADDEKITMYKNVNLGMAVMSGGYLKVAVLKNILDKDFKAINDEVSAIVVRANQDALTEEDFADGTFTISNGGRNEVEIVTPLINRPQTTILGFGKVGKRPLVINDEIAIRTTVKLCMTFDHRVLDGLISGQFIGRVKELIENKDQYTEILK